MEKQDITQYKDVWVFAEQRNNSLVPVVIELLGEGRRLANEIGVKLCAVLCGKDVSDLAKELITFDADTVYVVDNPLLENYTTDGYAKVITDAIREFKPEIVLYGATNIGRDLAPRIAARVNTGLTADCTCLEIDPEDKKLRQTRPAFGGNLMATIVCADRRPQMATVRPGVMEKAVQDKSRSGEIKSLACTLTATDIRTRVIEHVVNENSGSGIPLPEAEVIVSGGKGLGNPEGFQLLKQLATKLGGTVGASRAAVDAGWIDHTYQIGQTGTTVRPKIYIACGISGAIQHLAGMQSSDKIIAINKNPTAPIFQVADFGIVGDLYDVIPKIVTHIDNVEDLMRKACMCSAA